MTRGSRSRPERRLVWGLLLLAITMGVAGLAAGADGWSLPGLWDLVSRPEGALLIGEIRAPRTLGACLVGALFGLAGAVAQGLFRNPLADPYLLGSAAGSSLAVVLALGGASVFGWSQLGAMEADLGSQLGLVGAAFVGALGGVVLTLSLARGAQHTVRLLLAGVVVGVVLGALSDLVTTWMPQILSGKQSFLLGSTAYLSWRSCAVLGLGLVVLLPCVWRLSRVLDALTLGEDSARTLGVSLSPMRSLLVGAMALATGLAVSQAGLISFVGLVAPHLVRRFAPAAHGFHLLASAAMGGVLLMSADVLARSLLAPQELPVGVVTAVLGGGYLMLLLRKKVFA